MNLRCRFGVMVAGIWMSLVLSTGIAGAVTPDGYTITIGDELELDILDDSDPPQRFVVGTNGLVQLPFIGGIEVADVTLGEARQLIADAYVKREIFVAPTVELSVANFRPVFVMGDVRNPGNYEYQPFLTAEQAVGLAGGTAVSANNEEARILERRNLEGALNGTDADLARLAVQFARVQAQIEGSPEVRWTDLPETLRGVVDREMFDALKPKEDQIIALDDLNRTTQRRLIADAAQEAENRVALIDQRETVLVSALDLGREELQRARDLAERGLATQTAVSNAEQTIARQENEILSLREQRSGALVQLNQLQSELSRIDNEREKSLIGESQTYRSNIEKLMTERASIEDRLRLLEQWMSIGAGAESELLVGYVARRRTADGLVSLQLSAQDELAPGDQLVVTVRPPDGLEETGQGG